MIIQYRSGTQGMCNSSKAYYYKDFKSVLDTEKYLMIDMPYIYIDELEHILERHDNIEKMFRMCTYCLNINTYIIEDDLHFVLINEQII